jgi:hypothetical protein
MVKAFVLLVIVRLALWLLPFRRMWGLLVHLNETCGRLPEANVDTMERVVWTVEIASRYVPKATCLTQALAVQLLLGCYGCQSQLCIGVSKNTSGQIDAHAWVESQGRVVLGDWIDLACYSALPVLSTSPSDSMRWGTLYPQSNS